MIIKRKSSRFFQKFLTTTICLSLCSLTAFADNSESRSTALPSGLGTSSSASARVTLIIPPRPAQAIQTSKQSVSKKKTSISDPSEKEAKNDQ